MKIPIAFHRKIKEVLDKKGVVRRVVLNCGHAVWTSSTGDDPACYKCRLDFLHPNNTGSLWKRQKPKTGYTPENWIDYED